ncbi:MAG TPA: transglutaminase family protein [Stellaceae bacterium]|jgi:transglutaminase-like putative cysteine protease|nr:transglutaminase family protein [Stellaceae bacterium]
MMQRRDFLKAGAAASASALLPGASFATPFSPLPGTWRHFEIVTRIALKDGGGARRAWVPLPSIAEADWIKPLGDTWKIEGGTAAAHRVSPYGAKILVAEWKAGTVTPAIEVTSHVATRDRVVDLARPGTPVPLSSEQRALNLAATRLIPTDGIVKATADKITAGATRDIDKARRIYAWIIANTFRDPKVPGCGLGNIEFMLRTGNLGGKCADLNALFVGLARASGVPARDLYGIRVAPSRFGYKSLGANAEPITKAQHCRAEIWLDEYGWVPADPADVRKVVLEEPPGHLPMNDAKVAAARQTLFGAWEGNWVAYNDAHDVALPGSTGLTIGFLMYPQAESAAGRADCLDAANFSYTIESREIAI